MLNSTRGLARVSSGSHGTMRDNGVSEGSFGGLRVCFTCPGGGGRFQVLRGHLNRGNSPTVSNRASGCVVCYEEREKEIGSRVSPARILWCNDARARCNGRTVVFPLPPPPPLAIVCPFNVYTANYVIYFMEPTPPRADKCAGERARSVDARFSPMSYRPSVRKTLSRL